MLIIYSWINPKETFPSENLSVRSAAFEIEFISIIYENMKMEP